MEFDKEQTHEGTNIVFNDIELVEAKIGEWAEGEALAK